MTSFDKLLRDLDNKLSKEKDTLDFVRLAKTVAPFAKRRSVKVSGSDHPWSSSKNSSLLADPVDFEKSG